jgi:hypothetical protein
MVVSPGLFGIGVLVGFGVGETGFSVGVGSGEFVGLVAGSVVGMAAVGTTAWTSSLFCVVCTVDRCHSTP